ncbi:hypothetical protein Rs2_24529 [Raphanus sativus]|nr:hypothetical protein Rs2_24529 [Raphanus sativus]
MLKPDYIKKRSTSPHAYRLKDKLKLGLRSKLEIRTAQHRKPVEEVAHHVGSSAPKRDTRIHLLYSDRFRLTAAETTTFTTPVRRSSELTDASTRNHHRSSPRCRHAG